MLPLVLGAHLVACSAGEPRVVQTKITKTVAHIVEECLLLTPAVLASYGTYRTLTEPIGGAFARACKNFDRAMRYQANERYPSTVIRACIVNFSRYFKTHEKMAMLGSGVALCIGATATIVGSLKLLDCCYNYFSATTDAERKLHQQSLEAALAKIFGIGVLSLSVGIISALLLSDYAASGLARK
jgi:hypothetical protein